MKEADMRRSHFFPLLVLSHLHELTACLVFPLVLCPLTAAAQFESYGLVGRAVYSLATYGSKLYAGTDDGVYMQPIGQGTKDWSLLGLKGKRVRSVYPHSFGPIGYAITVGIERMPGDIDSTLIYCSRYSDTSWVPADDGIDRNELGGIMSIDGFPSPAICGETFAAGGGRVYRGMSGVWERVFDIGIGFVNVVKANSTTVSVMAGGETGIFAPYISLSRDKGASWITVLPNLGGDNACNSLAFDPADTTVVYAGMEGVVIKTTDGGYTWTQTLLAGTPYYFYALAIAQFTETIFVSGSTNTGGFGLYSSNDGGKTWVRIVPTIQVDGALSMAIIPTVIPESNILLIGTRSSGVIGYSFPFTSAGNDLTPGAHKLGNNYPNPFNPSTTIRYTIGGLRQVFVKLIMYDALGRDVKTIVSSRQGPGTYEATWDGTNDAGVRLASGTYVSRLLVGSSVSSHTVLLLK